MYDGYGMVMCKLTEIMTLQDVTSPKLVIFIFTFNKK